MVSAKNIYLLCNFDVQEFSETASLNKLWSGEWTIENVKLCQKLLETNLEKESLELFVKNHLETEQSTEPVLILAISVFLTFCNQNWDPHPTHIQLEHYLCTKWPSHLDVTIKLQRDSEPVYVNVVHQELLYFSMQLFSALYLVQPNLLSLWWCFRSKVIHQKIIEDTSASLFAEIEIIVAKLLNEVQTLSENSRLKILLYTEIAQAYLLYGRVQKVEEYLVKAKELAGLKLELTGILGKRTKFQLESLAQLALNSELDATIERPTAEESHGSAELPQVMELQDDVRLDKIDYSSKSSTAELPSLEQTLCLLTVQYLEKAQPKDALLQEELQPYIEAVLCQKNGPWSTRVAALLMRCKLESNHKRTVERAMRQCEAIVNDESKISCTTRLSYLFASGLKATWTWRQQLGDLYLSLGLVKAALEEYLQLQLWEDVIVCYTLLQLRHKAAEVIQQQLDLRPTVKLYCLLGDATDDISCYEKAWQFSECKSSRAQRHWGNFLYDRKQYEECIPHFEKSLEINSLQENVWLRLGYAALVTEQWELCAKSYRRYTYLHPNSFEAWNNLAKAYVKLGDKRRAHRALIESLRFNYDNWKLWENVIVVSMDTGNLEDVLRGCHRVLDLQHRYEDIEVLELLVRSVLQDAVDADGNPAGRLRKRVLELFGRITSIHQNRPEIWQCYSDLSPTYLLKAQRLLKAYRGYTQGGTWPTNPVTCKKVIELVHSLLDYSLKAREEATESEVLQADQQLSSARLTGQAVIRAAEKQAWPEITDHINHLKKLFESVTEYIKSNVQ